MKNNLFKLILFVSLVFVLVFSLASCDLFGGSDAAENDSSNSSQNTDLEHTHGFSSWISTKTPTCKDYGEEVRACECGEREVRQISKGDHNYINGKCNTCGKDQGILMDSFDYSKIPEYSGKEYVVLNANVPFFTDSEKVTTSYETYGNFDSLGRCTAAFACIGKDIMPDSPRGNGTSFQPTGWIQAQYSFVSGQSLYNRCHLIAWQLTAETTNRQNLMTGTRYMNEAMIPFENMIAAYIKETNNHVMFRATPVFVGDNLLANGLLLEAYSVEDDGDGISINVFFYNVQPGVKINYATGASSAANGDTSSDEMTDCDYILNTSNKKIHTPTCGNANAIGENNKDYYSGSIEDLKEDGYVAAGCCNPT